MASSICPGVYDMRHRKAHLGALGINVLVHPAVTMVAEYEGARLALTALRGGVTTLHHLSTFTEIHRVIGSPGAAAVAERYGMLPLEPSA